MSRRYRPWRREQQFVSRVKALTVTLDFDLDDPEPGPSFWADLTDDCGIGEPDDRKVEAWASWAERFPMSAAIVRGVTPTKLDVATQQRHMAIEQEEG